MTEERTTAAAPSHSRNGTTLRHIAFIVDGNRRWARHHGVGIDEGHRQGILKIPAVLGWCDELAIPMATFWILSIRNLTERGHEEIAGLFRVYEELAAHLSASRWPVRVIGFLDLLPAHLADAYTELEAQTRGRPGSQANIALAYDGRQEIVHAIRSLATAADPCPQVDEEILQSHLLTAGLPDPDLILRTSGEQRLSGFMTWQSAHTELYFCDSHWPDFTKEDFQDAVRSYHTRERRYGK
ncbi:polyprenyl diphosphate synthase [Actinomadura sp. 1N219]|uniref:polyprenyl diphosphate synthase n=1 Tax=Actinomadura sp. 1N219 TaxID=3375152 RepID=UPI003790F282